MLQLSPVGSIGASTLRMPSSVAPAAPSAPEPPAPRTPEQVIADSIAMMTASPFGKALHDETVGKGTGIIVTDKSAYADYSRPNVRLNPKLVDGSRNIAGVLAHELAHAYMDRSGMLPQLHTLPFRLGFLANEIVSEAIASAIAKQSGFERGGSSVTRKDGTLRSMRGALDDILANDFYVKYYKLDLTQITEEVRARTAREFVGFAAQAITELGGTVPKEYFVPGPRLV